MFVWSGKHVIGIDSVDTEHETFSHLVSSFGQAMEINADKKVLLGILDEIALFAKFHFRSEENTMETLGFPDFMRHKELHMQLIDDLSNKILGLSLDRFTPKSVGDFLCDWFFSHTMNEDKKLAEFQKRSASQNDN